MNKIILGGLSAVLCVNAFATQAKCSKHMVELVTNYGNIDIQLDVAKAPVTVANFEQYVTSGFYKDKIFHRVIPGFMIQGGGFDIKMQEARTNSAIKNEANNGLPNDKYTIAMARTSNPDSATAQFFINVNNNTNLNYTSATPAGAGYAVFGRVIKGQAIVDKIALVKTTSNGPYQDVPVEAVLIKSAKIMPCK